MPHFNWTLIQTFLAVVEHGSFSAAGRALSISQPTVGRHIQDLEKQLDSVLFARETRGHQLTDAGLSLVEHAQDMQAAAAHLSLVATGQSARLSGSVRITASIVVSHYLLPPILARIRQAEPEIELELHPSDDSENLLFHEADIAVRMYRPDQLDVITRRVGRQIFGIYGNKSYLDRVGRPTTIEQVFSHDFIGYDRSDLMIKAMRQMGIAADRSWFAVRCDNQSVYLELLRAGCGLGVAPVNIAGKDPALERVMPELPLPDLPIWLTAHAALRSSPRIRRVYDMLADGLNQVAGD
ncbi:MAG: LysR family transcriptional regulator [Rhodobacteraceae bacterium]|nr:LysR family transcriptional regulator [Paracoccaceae bacterium]